MCYVTIFDGDGKPITVEVSREIYQVFIDYEREMERQRKEEYRHRDARSWDTCLIFEVSTESLEQTYERMQPCRKYRRLCLPSRLNSDVAFFSILLMVTPIWRSPRWKEATNPQ